MLMHDLEVLCNEPWCCILCWKFDMQFSYATHLAHPVLCRPTHFNISGYASGVCVCVCDWVMVIVTLFSGVCVIGADSCVGAVDDGKCSP